MSLLTKPYLVEREMRGSAFNCEERLKTIELFPKDHLEIDYANGLIKVANKKNDSLSFFYKFSEVASVSARVDEKSSSGKSTSSMLGRAAILGLLTGGAGAVVGAMTAKTVTRRQVRSVALIVNIVDLDYPLEHILFTAGFFKGYGADEALQMAEKVIARIQKTASKPESDAHLIERLSQLGELYERGLLSQLEYDQAKSRLLA